MFSFMVSFRVPKVRQVLKESVVILAYPAPMVFPARKGHAESEELKEILVRWVNAAVKVTVVRKGNREYLD